MDSDELMKAMFMMNIVAMAPPVLQRKFAQKFFPEIIKKLELHLSPDEAQMLSDALADPPMHSQTANSEDTTTTITVNSNPTPFSEFIISCPLCYETLGKFVRDETNLDLRMKDAVRDMFKKHSSECEIARMIREP